jgi:hypothetical protein
MSNTPGPATRVASHPTAHPALGIVAAVCAYEVVADVLNDTLGAPLLPSMRGAVNRFSWARFGRRMVPRGSLQAGFVAVGFAATVALRGRRTLSKPSGQTSKR